MKRARSRKLMVTIEATEGRLGTLLFDLHEMGVPVHTINVQEELHHTQRKLNGISSKEIILKLMDGGKHVLLSEMRDAFKSHGLAPISVNQCLTKMQEAKLIKRVDKGVWTCARAGRLLALPAPNNHRQSARP